MIASTASFTRPSPIEDLHAGFLALLPKIVTHARIRFRLLKCRARKEEAIQECVSLAWKWHVRLRERGKNAADFPVTFCRLVIKAVKSGRRVCGSENATDVLSPLAQQRHGFAIESLPLSTRTAMDDLYSRPHGQQMRDAFEERLRDNTVTPPPEAAAFRIDWPRFCASLPARDQELAVFLSLGHSGKAAAAQFRVSQGRVTQLRQKWCRQWRQFESGGERDQEDGRKRAQRAVAG